MMCFKKKKKIIREDKCTRTAVLTLCVIYRHSPAFIAIASTINYRDRTESTLIVSPEIRESADEQESGAIRWLMREDGCAT